MRNHDASICLWISFQVHKAFHVRSGEIVAIKKAKETVADRDVGGTEKPGGQPLFLAW